MYYIDVKTDKSAVESFNDLLNELSKKLTQSYFDETTFLKSAIVESLKNTIKISNDCKYKVVDAIKSLITQEVVSDVEITYQNVKDSDEYKAMTHAEWVEMDNLSHTPAAASSSSPNSNNPFYKLAGNVLGWTQEQIEQRIEKHREQGRGMDDLASMLSGMNSNTNLDAPVNEPIFQVMTNLLFNRAIGSSDGNKFNNTPSTSSAPVPTSSQNDNGLAKFKSYAESKHFISAKGYADHSQLLNTAKLTKDALIAEAKARNFNSEYKTEAGNNLLTLVAYLGDIEDGAAKIKALLELKDAQGNYMYSPCETTQDDYHRNLDHGVTPYFGNGHKHCVRIPVYQLLKESRGRNTPEQAKTKLDSLTKCWSERVEQAINTNNTNELNKLLDVKMLQDCVKDIENSPFTEGMIKIYESNMIDLTNVNAEFFMLQAYGLIQEDNLVGLESLVKKQLDNSYKLEEVQKLLSNLYQQKGEETEMAKVIVYSFLESIAINHPTNESIYTSGDLDTLD